MVRVIDYWLNRSAISKTRFENALKETAKITGKEKVHNRIALTAAVAANPGSTFCDIGGSVAEYHIIMSLLDMEITAVDVFEDNPWLSEETQIVFNELKDQHREIGINLVNANFLTEQFLVDKKFDACGAFETIEHIPYSPAPLLKKIKSITKDGGQFFMSLPNIARLEVRGRLLAGRSPLERYAPFYEAGDSFGGHFREMTVSEVNWLAERNGMTECEVFTTDISPGSNKPKRRGLKRIFSDLNYKYGLSEFVTPQTMRKSIWLRATW